MADKYGSEADDAQDETLRSRSLSKSEKFYSDAYRLKKGRLDSHYFHEWANVIISQGEHRRRDYQHILALEPRNYKQDVTEAQAAYSQAQYSEAVSLYQMAYDKSREATFLTDIVDCYITSHGFSSRETVAAAKKALVEVSKTGNTPRYDDSETTAIAEHEEEFLKGLINAAPHFSTAQVKEKQGDLIGAAEAGYAALWASSKAGIVVAFQYRIMAQLGRYKDRERMLRLQEEESAASSDPRLIPLYLEQGR